MNFAILRLGAGLILAIGTWIGLRTLGSAKRTPSLGALVLDALPTTFGFALFLLATARPVLAGLGIAALGFGLGLTDVMKRKILREPVVFADRAELLDVVRHPRFYIAFVGTGRMIVGTLVLAASIVLVLMAEPPIWHTQPIGSVAAIVIAVVLGRLAFVLPATSPLVQLLASRYRRWQPTYDPEVDAARFGLLASLMMQATIARAERSARQIAVSVPWPALPKRQGPIVLWQAESFVDPAMLDPDLAGRLPQYERLKAEALLSGRLTVPAWGANTIRTELAAVAGIGPNALGLDRFNPYDAFVDLPLRSLAQAARDAGYRSICIHPYSRTFYSRHKVMPLLGFDRFIGIEAFAGAESDGGYVTDRALAAFVADLVDREGEDLFLFLISIENHGPWDAKHDHLPPAQLPPTLAALSDAAGIARWLRHAEAADTAFGLLRDTIEKMGQGWLAIYGDHQPSLGAPFDTSPETGRTDYLIWRAGANGGEKRDLAAEDLPIAWRDLMRSSGL